VWRHRGVEISSFDPAYTLLDDFSLQINSVGDLNGGTYTVSANNGVCGALSWSKNNKEEPHFLLSLELAPFPFIP
jgi:hypothetical protein